MIVQQSDCYKSVTNSDERTNEQSWHDNNDDDNNDYDEEQDHSLQEVLKQLDLSSKHINTKLKVDDYLAVGVGIRFLNSKKDHYVGKFVDSNFIDIVMNIVNSHLKLSYFANMRGENDIRMTIRNSRHVIFSTIHNNCLTVIVFSNLKYVGNLKTIPFNYPNNYFKSTTPVGSDTNSSCLNDLKIDENHPCSSSLFSSNTRLPSFSPISQFIDPTTANRNTSSPLSATASIESWKNSTASDDTKSHPINSSATTLSNISSMCNDSFDLKKHEHHEMHNDYPFYRTLNSLSKQRSMLNIRHACTL